MAGITTAEQEKQPMLIPPTAYLTVISWPTKMSELDRARSLVECTGMDLYQAKLAARRNTPGIMRELDPEMAGAVLGAMHARGVLCIAPTQDDIDASPVAQAALGVDQFPDADPPRFVVKLPDADAWTFTSEQVWLIVAGRLKSTSFKVEEPSSPSSLAAVSPEYAMIQIATNEGAYANKRLRVRDVIDLHIRSDRGERIVRLIGPRARIGIVGDNARPSLLDQTKPLDLIEVLMPNATVDTEFGDFDPPHRLRRLASKTNRDSGHEKIEYWSFYSPWVAQIRLAMGD